MPDGFAALPHWPLLMDEATACRFTSFKPRDFRALVACQVFPPARAFPPKGVLRWHRAELEAVMARFYGLDAAAPDQQDAAARQAARDALNAFDPDANYRTPTPRPGRR
jgi:hypothetical protein